PNAPLRVLPLAPFVAFAIGAEDEDLRALRRISEVPLRVPLDARREALVEIDARREERTEIVPRRFAIDDPSDAGHLVDREALGGFVAARPDPNVANAREEIREARDRRFADARLGERVEDRLERV